MALQNTSAATVLKTSSADAVIKKNHHQYPRGAIKVLNQIYDGYMAHQCYISYMAAVSCIRDFNLNHSLKSNASTGQQVTFGIAFLSVGFAS